MNQKIQRPGVPTMMEKNRYINDTLNLEKLGIPNKKRRRGSANISDGEANDFMRNSTTAKLMEVFENIQMHRLFKQKMEMFILLFNQDPNRGINFLIGNELVRPSYSRFEQP
mgnify:CR=1 FL=1